MRRMTRARLAMLAMAVAVTVRWNGTAGADAQGDPQQLLAAARQALGGDEALAAVRSFLVSGSGKLDLGFAIVDHDVELACQLPDRFVRRAAYDSLVGGPPGLLAVTTQRDGFAGAAVIRETVNTGHYAPSSRPVMPGPSPTPDQRAAAERLRLLGQQQRFARLALVLFAASPAAYPLRFVPTGPATLPDGRTGSAVEAVGPDDFVMRLVIDDESHLPVTLTWKQRAVLMATATASSVFRAGRSAPPGVVVTDRFPLADPRSVPLVDHVLEIGEYRVADGLRWPHRLTERIDGRVLEDLKLGKYKLNPRIAASKFKTGEQ